MSTEMDLNSLSFIESEFINNKTKFSIIKNITKNV